MGHTGGRPVTAVPMELPFSHATVLGAGLMGRLLALALARRGCTVALYDAHGPGGEGAAAHVAAAMLAPLAESAIAPLPIVRMGHHGLAHWQALLATLPMPVFFQRSGTLVLWHRQDAPVATQFAQQLARTARDCPELPVPQQLAAADIATLEPALGNRFSAGLLLPGEGQTHNRDVLDALRQALQAEPRVRLHWHTPAAPQDFAPATHERLIDCRGLGARADWPAPRALRGVRGEVLRVFAPEVGITRPVRLMHPRYPLYIAPKPGGHYVIGATEIESEDMSPVSVRSTLELLSAAYAVHSGFAEGRITESATQCRPTLPDNLPTVQEPSPRCWQVNGLYRHGFLVAPALVDITLELLATGRSPLAQQLGLPLAHHP